MKDENFAGNAKHMIDFLGKEWSYNCMGCAIREKQIIPPGGSIYEGKSFFVQQDPEVPIEGFLIVNVKQHVKSMMELIKEERSEMIELINMSIKALKDLGITDEVTIVQEERSKHLHVWVFPTYPWMIEKFGKGITHLRAIHEYAQEHVTKEDVEKIMNTIEKLKEYFKINM